MTAPNARVRGLDPGSSVNPTPDVSEPVPTRETASATPGGVGPASDKCADALGMARRPKTARAWSWSRGRGPPIPEGTRNLQLTRIGGSLRGRGLEHDEILTVLLDANAVRCCPPLREAEVRTIAKPVSRYRPGPPRVAAPVGSDNRKAVACVVDRGHPPLCSACRLCLTDGACPRCRASLCGHCGPSHRCPDSPSTDGGRP